MKILKKETKQVDFSRNKSMIAEKVITTNTEKYLNVLHKAVGIDAGVKHALEQVAGMEDEAKMVEQLRMIVEYFDLREYLKKNIH